MIRKKKKFVRPKKLYESSRIKEENEILKKYGLKNKREIWKMQAKVDYYRKRAMVLAKSTIEEQEVLFKKLRNLGLNVKSIADVLALTIKDILERRLQTIVYKKGLAKTVKHARQMIVHKKVLIDNKVNNISSYLVPVEEEDKIKLKEKLKEVKQ